MSNQDNWLDEILGLFVYKCVNFKELRVSTADLEKDLKQAIEAEIEKRYVAKKDFTETLETIDGALNMNLPETAKAYIAVALAGVKGDNPHAN